MTWLGLGPDEWTAVRLSLLVASVAALASLPIGIATAYVLARKEFWGKTLLNGLVHLPLILPPVVTGYLLLLSFGRQGPIGAFLDRTLGLVFAFRWTGAALAAGVMAFPLMVRAIRLSIEAVDRKLEAASQTLGASPLWVFLTVTLPLASSRHHRRRDPRLRQGHGRVRSDNYLRLEHSRRDTNTAERDLHLHPGARRRVGCPQADARLDRDRDFGAHRIGGPRPPGRGANRRMTLSFSARHLLGDFQLDARFATSGRLTALFGPSGSGKSTIVNLIAGLERAGEARIEVNGRVLADTSAGVFLPAHRRRIGYVFQDARLLPHLSVRQNLLYGRAFAPKAERPANESEVVGMLGIGHLLARRPASLSGGERQRVAIGRALLSSPRLILMDEPLASLDEARKSEILPYIERLRDEQGIPIVYVSHSVAEVARLATDIVILSHGKAVASGHASEVLEQLENLGGEGREEAGVLLDLVLEAAAGDGLGVYRSAGGTWRLPLIGAAPGTKVRARIRARDVMLATEMPRHISALNVQQGVVESISESEGYEALVRIACGPDRMLARITKHSLRALELAPGSSVYVIVKAVSIAGSSQPSVRPRET